MKKLILSAILLVLLACFTAITCFADAYEYYPNEDGCYTVVFEGETSNEYIIIVVKGIYDETNFVEAYNAASEEDILYYEQLASLDDGSVVFGPFVPKAYFDSTVIIGGTNLAEPQLAGYLRAAGVSNVASVEIYGVEDKYTVQGLDGEDVVIEVEAELLDSFGYPAITDDNAIISVQGDFDGVTVDSIEGTVIINKCAKEGEFTITATYGSHSDSRIVNVVREESVAHSILVYTSEETKVPVSNVAIELVEGEEYAYLTLYSESYDQYGDLFDENRTAFVGNVENADAENFEFSAEGEYTIKIASESNAAVYALVSVIVTQVPAYEGNAFDLHTLIKECDAELALIGVTKFVSENGRDIYPEHNWTTSASKTAFETALASAKDALYKYNIDEITVDDLASYVTSLTSAKTTYLKSFGAGLKVDITSLSITNESYRIPVTNSLVGIGVTYSPAKNTDTITWKSSDPETVYVDEQGRMIAKENGTVVITATTSTGITAATTVTAYTKATRIQLAESSIELVYGSEPYVLKVVAYPATQSEILTWSSSKPDIATVDSSGTIVPQCKAGTTKILVVGEHGLAAECEVRVKLPAWETVATPVASIEDTDVFKGTSVELTTATEGASIFYTLDGSEPTTQSRPYVSPITINSSMTIKAIAVADRMFDSSVAAYDYTVVVPEISMTNTVVSKGNTAKIKISLTNNPGITSLEFGFRLPEGVELEAVSAGSALTGLTLENSEDDGVHTLKWSGTEADASEGEIAILTVRALEGIPEGERTVEYTGCTATDKFGTTANLNSVGGKINIIDAMLGDVDNDGSIGMPDVVLLAQYCAQWDSALELVDVAAADVDADGTVGMPDVVLLAQYCAQWDVTLG